MFWIIFLAVLVVAIIYFVVLFFVQGAVQFKCAMLSSDDIKK